jgi:nitrate reductase gamma subunit
LLELGTSDHFLHILLGLVFVAGALSTRADADSHAR